MTLYTRSAAPRHARAQVYASIGLETQVLGASPERLISLLFDGAQAAIAKARLCLQQGNVEGRGMAISKALDIVDSGLKASVDRQAGGALADNLIAAYDVILHRLLRANLHADDQSLAEAGGLLREIGAAWRTATDPNKPESGAI